MHEAAAKGLEWWWPPRAPSSGPHDYKPSRMGRALCDFANGKMRAYIPGGFEFVAARDIVEGHVLAMETRHSAPRSTSSPPSSSPWTS